ncbi:hypothetical protein BJ912DRAFT_1113197 [Pholiota molesta]|nr:hypothetical protein BJ912DRAFT_1113197 [Pholiota molesta]
MYLPRSRADMAFAVVVVVRGVECATSRHGRLWAYRGMGHLAAECLYVVVSLAARTGGRLLTSLGAWARDYLAAYSSVSASTLRMQHNAVSVVGEVARVVGRSEATAVVVGRMELLKSL